MIRFSCSQCGAAFKVDDSKAGKKGTCPTCGHPIHIPEPESNSAMDPLEALDDPSVASAPPESGFSSLTAPEDGPECPNCNQRVPAGETTCRICGIKVPSGRPILAQGEFEEDEVAAVATNITDSLGLFLPFGFYPIQIGCNKRPLATWLLVVATVILGAWFCITDTVARPQAQKLAYLMLWDKAAPTLVSSESPTTGPSVPEKASTSTETKGRTKRRRSDDDRSRRRAALRKASATSGPLTGSFRSFQWVTHAFLHSDPFHLVGNAFLLLVFGMPINKRIGNIGMLILYPALAALAVWLRVTLAPGGFDYPFVGASGAVMGLCGVYLVLFPFGRVHLLMWSHKRRLFSSQTRWETLPGAPGLLFVAACIAFDVAYVATKVEGGPAHFGHVGAFVVGVCVAFVVMALRLSPPGASLPCILLGKRAWAFTGRPAPVQ